MAMHFDETYMIISTVITWTFVPTKTKLFLRNSSTDLFHVIAVCDAFLWRTINTAIKQVHKLNSALFSEEILKIAQDLWRLFVRTLISEVIRWCLIDNVENHVYDKTLSFIKQSTVEFKQANDILLISYQWVDMTNIRTV